MKGQSGTGDSIYSKQTLVRPVLSAHRNHLDNHNQNLVHKNSNRVQHVQTENPRKLPHEGEQAEIHKIRVRKKTEERSKL